MKKGLGALILHSLIRVPEGTMWNLCVCLTSSVRHRNDIGTDIGMPVCCYRWISTFTVAPVWHKRMTQSVGDVICWKVYILKEENWRYSKTFIKQWKKANIWHWEFQIWVQVYQLKALWPWASHFNCSEIRAFHFSGGKYNPDPGHQAGCNVDQ